MNETNKDFFNLNLKKKVGNKWSLFEKVHKLILSQNKKIEFCLLTIYVVYYLGDNNVAVIYFKGKSAKEGLDVGLNLTQKPKSKFFTRAKHMSYPGINYCVKIEKTSTLTVLSSALKLLNI